MTDETEPTCPNDPAHKFVGVEIRGVYDGVLFWECPIDGIRFQRWPKGSRQYKQTQELWAKWAKDEKR